MSWSASTTPTMPECINSPLTRPVTGLIHPKRIYQNAGAKPGDKLILTKALGTGVISTAIKKGEADQSWIDDAVRSMTTLNKQAAEVIATGHVGTAAIGRPVERGSTNSLHAQSNTTPYQVHAMTDITGFGLIGHLREILLASDVSAEIHADKIPLLEGALDCIRSAHIPGGLKNNRDFAECLVDYDPEVPHDLRTILYDPQTAGGLLISTPAGAAIIKALNEAQVPAVQIGEVLPIAKPRIRISL